MDEGVASASLNLKETLQLNHAVFHKIRVLLHHVVLIPNAVFSVMVSLNVLAYRDTWKVQIQSEVVLNNVIHVNQILVVEVLIVIQIGHLCASALNILLAIHIRAAKHQVSHLPYANLDLVESMLIVTLSITKKNVIVNLDLLEMVILDADHSQYHRAIQIHVDQVPHVLYLLKDIHNVNVQMAY